MGKGKKWPAYYYEDSENGSNGASDANHYAFVTVLAYDFLFKILSKNLEN